MSDTDKPSWDTLRDEAALWLARMDSGSADPAEFEAWRNADPRHAAAFVQIAGALAVLDRVKPEMKAQMAASPSKPPRRWFLSSIVAATVAGAAVTAFALHANKASASTKIGERKSVDLPGGGILELNTDSQASWRRRDNVTEVWLGRGEISVTVSGSNTACLLHLPGKTARIANARVNARLRGTVVDLSVVEGNCELNAASSSNNRPGAQGVVVPPDHAVTLSATAQSVRSLSAADVAFLSAWPKGELVFQGQTLETAVGEYNRYLDRKIVIVDPSLAAIRLGGRFSSHDPASFLDALHGGFGIKVIDDGTGSVALTK